MKSPNRILVPMDFSEPSNAALDYALSLGEHFCAKVDFLYVWLPPEEVSSNIELLVEFAKSDEGHKMKDVLASCEGHGVQARGCVTSGGRSDVSDAIVKMADEDYDLVVMGKNEHRGLLSLLRRRTVEKVMQRASCPVVAIPAVA